MKIAIAGLLTVILTLSAALTGCAPKAKGPGLPTIPTAGVLLSPVRGDSAGIDPTAGFHLASATALTLAQVQQLFTVAPAVELQYEQADKEGKLFTVKPARALDADRVYRFKLAAGQGVEREYQWSFQTRADFRVLGVLPRHQATQVPLDTGIELTFSHEEYADIDSFFTISPKVEGRFERHKKTVVFVPKQKLQPGTVYTVTLKPGLALKESELQLTQEVRFAFETESAAQADQRQPNWVSVPVDLQQYPEGVTPYFPVDYYSQERGREMAKVAVTLYRYKDATQLIAALKKAGELPWWANYSQGQYKEETKGLTRVSAFEAQLQQLPGHHQTHLLFPESMKPGYYLAELKIENQVRQVRLQVSDLTGHLTVAENQSLLWLNDLATKAPVAGAEVSHPGGKSKTAADGTAAFETPKSFGGSDSEGLYLTVKAGAKEAVVAVRPGGYFFYDIMPMGRGPIWPGPWPAQTGTLDYWKYLYTDRPLYKPQDTVQLFGVLKPREGGAKAPKSVTASLIRREYRGWDEQPIALVKQELPVVSDTYTGTLQLPNLKPGGYELQIQMDGQYVQSRWIEVQAYTKPAYTVTVTPSRRAIFQEESVDFKVSATFFEGTPVPGLTFNYAIGWGGDHRQQQVTTGADGTATIRFTPGPNDPYKGQEQYWGPMQAYLNLWASLPEAGEINAGAHVQVFSRDITFQPRVEVEESGAAVIHVQANHVSLEQLNASGDSWDFTGKPLAGARVEGVLTEISWVRVPSGEYYDFIEKKVVQTYDYREERRDAGRFTATTDSEGKLAHRLSVDPTKSYQVRLTLLDSKERPVTTIYHFSGRHFTVKRGGMPEYRWFNLAPLDPKRQDGWNVGEEAALQVRENDAPAADRSRGFLFIEARRGLGRHAVQDTGTYRLRLTESDLPNTNLRAVYFDGQRYHDAGEQPVRFNPLHRELKVLLTPDKSVYRPGEMVGVTVKVTDKAGRPVRAQLNLNLVDEALYALRDQSADILGSLYGDHVPSGILRSHAGSVMTEAMDMGRAGNMALKSAPPMAPAPGAAAGREMEQSTQVRTEFKDAAYFTTIATDEAGQGRASFKLPDNLTTWRLTYQAFAPGVMGGATGTAPVTVKIPFFVDMVVAPSYLTGDKPVMTVRSFGLDLAEGQSVSYAVTVTGPDGGRFERQVSGRAFSPVLIPLEQLKTGTYTVQVRGTAGTLTDAMEQQVTVVETYLKQPKVSFQLLQNGQKPQGSATGLTQVIFADYNRGRYLHLLERLSWSGGNRFEHRLARSVASDLLKEHFGREQFWKDSSFDPLSYQTPDGSVAILPYSDGDLYLSALVADLAPDLVDQGALAAYFEKILDDPKLDRERATLALYGLAALDRPVLRHVASLRQTKGLSAAEQLNLALATTALGDMEGARPAWKALWKEHGEQLGGNARLKLGRDQDEILQSTAQAAVVAARLGEPEAMALVGYLLENHPQDLLLSLELLMVAREILPSVAKQPVGFTAIIGGEERRVELQAGESVAWHLTPQQIASMQIRAVKGDVSLTTVYEAPLSAGDIRQEAGYSLRRSYSVVGRPGATDWKAGDLIRISLEYSLPGTAPAGGYEVTDYLPAGLKLIERPWQHGIQWQMGRHMDPAWPMAVEGQRISFWAWKDGYPIAYYARVVTPGEYTAEQPALQHMQSGVIYKVGERVRVRVGP